MLGRALQGVSGFEGRRIEGLTGVWVDDQKVAAVGIRARRWIAYHGLALNVTVDLDAYKYIVPCGIQDKHVTNIKMLMQQHGVLEQMNSDSELMTQYASGLLAAFEEVFQVKLQSFGTAARF